MLKRIFVIIAATIALASATFVSAQTEVTTEPPQTPPGGAYASVNGLEMYYETHGSGGIPLILLHGGLISSDTYAPFIPTLAENRQVIAIDVQAHGRTADIDRPLSMEAMADDIAALLAELGIENADFMGYSLGGSVSLQTAIRHPELVRKLVLISTVFARSGWYPEANEGMAAMNAEAAAFMLETPLYELYSSVAPNVEDWPQLVGKMGDMLRQDYDWTEQVDALQQPALIIIADSDSVMPAHAIELFQLFGGGVPGDFVGQPASQLAIIPNTTHGSVIFRADAILALVTPFLDAPLPEPAA
jgi:pimeloyl-ACP methyl ester carboxylesterase